MRRLAFLVLAGLIATTAVVGGLYRWASMPTAIRIAVGPAHGDDYRLIAAIAQYLVRERADLRVKLEVTDGVAASAQALETGRADMAVVRTDVAVPQRGQTVAILHRDAAVILAPSSRGIERLADLQNRRVGVVRGSPANELLLQEALGHYEIPRETVVIVPLDSPREIEPALRDNRLDAVMAVGTLTGRTIQQAVAAVAAASGGAVSFVGIREADAIAQRLPAFESIEVVRGAFGGVEPRPAEPLQTIGVSHRLVAHTGLAEDDVSEFTRLLFAMRPAIAGEVPLANRIDSPDTSKSSVLPVHPGALAYYEGEVLTFMERYGDWIYLGAMFGGVIGSGLAAIVGAALRRSRKRTASLLNDTLAIVHAARTAESSDDLDLLDAEADAVLVAALSKAGHGSIDTTNLLAFQLGLDQARRAIEERREWLVQHSARRSLAAE